MGPFYCTAPGASNESHYDHCEYAGGLEVAKRPASAWLESARPRAAPPGCPDQQLPDAELDLDEKAVSWLTGSAMPALPEVPRLGRGRRGRPAGQRAGGRGRGTFWARCPTCFICGSLHRATGGRSGCRSSMGRPWNRPSSSETDRTRELLPDISSAMPRCSRPSMTRW